MVVVSVGSFNALVLLPAFSIIISWMFKAWIDTLRAISYFLLVQEQ